MTEKLVGEMKKKMCPTTGMSCVKANCEWWCNARCAIPSLVEAQEVMNILLEGKQ